MSLCAHMSPQYTYVYYILHIAYSVDSKGAVATRNTT